MGKPILLLRLEGPLQSWGSRARWDVRDTSSEPTKSGVIGLLGCSLGCPVGDPRLEKLDAGLRFGVRVECPGAVLEDYQTITDFLPMANGGYKKSGGVAVSLRSLESDPDARPATILSPRFYLEDAAFLVALEERTSPSGERALPAGLTLAKIADALQAPAWPLFLGRKACIPTRPVFEVLTERYANLEAALNHHGWSWLGARRELREGRNLPDKLRILVEPESNQGGVILRQDALRVGLARQYAFRPEKEEESIRRDDVMPGKGAAG